MSCWIQYICIMEEEEAMPVWLKRMK
ncbi:hypothetical protein HPG69_010332 [Diceros bicornis minor]|uniref:Uncharacterized protein n=1 Tax=Diceros bicornis minor TaxID=77932 RepID=A0A7J7F787_DICBM|nr:hypothetical protein HPG69_010332 [Diceros bicornis minor]